MATTRNFQSGGHLHPQQNIVRPHSSSSPQVLSRPTLSHRKMSSPSPTPNDSSDGNELKLCQLSISPPKQQVFLTSSRKYSNDSLEVKQRPIHSIYSASQPQLNLEESDKMFHFSSIYSGNYVGSIQDQRNRWSTLGLGESSDDDFKSRSIGRSYDVSLTKCSVEDLRPLPVAVAAPKVPPRRGSRLTTVPDRRHPEQTDKRYRETRSCEDILESVSTEELKDGQSNTNEYHERHLKENGAYRIQSKAPQQFHPIHNDCTAIPKSSDHHSMKTFQESRDRVSTDMPHSSHTSNTHQSEVTGECSSNHCSTSNQLMQQNSDQNDGIVNESTETKEYYLKGSSVPIPLSIHATESINPRNVTADSACSSVTGVSSITTQLSSPTPPVYGVNDANLRLTPHTSYSSPSPSPQAYSQSTEKTVINIPQNYQPFLDNKVTTAPHVPHYALPTNSSSSHTQVTGNDPVQNSSMVQSAYHSYRLEPCHALSVQTSTPSNNNSTHLHRHIKPIAMLPAPMPATAMAQPNSYSLTQSVDVKPTETQSQSVSKKAQAFAQAFSQWQYHGTDTAKKKQGSIKPNVRSEEKPPVKPKPVRLTKGSTFSLKRDKSKQQTLVEASAKKKVGQKYVFKQTQSHTLLSRGRTSSQVDPLTDIEVETQYNYTSQNQSQPDSGSRSNSTLREESRFTDSQNSFTASGPSPNSYDYGSQMTPTGDATLTPSHSPEMCANPRYAQGRQPPMQHINREHVDEHSIIYSANTAVQTNAHKNCQPDMHGANTALYTNAVQSATMHPHVKPPSPHPCVNNGYSRIFTTANDQNICCSPNEVIPAMHLAPIAEVNLESEQSMSSLLSATDQSETSQNGMADLNVKVDDASTKLVNVSQETSEGICVNSNKLNGKLNLTVHRSSTLPSLYKRPKPYRFNPHKYQSIGAQVCENESTDNESIFSLPSIKLCEFTALNTNLFPKQIKISNAFTCSSGEVKISQGDVLDLHFVRQTKVVMLMSNEGKEYIVPLNSAIRFALTYDPLNTGQLVNKGYYFKSVGELIATRVMPKVVVATEAYSDPNPLSSVEAGEVLVICGVVKQAQGRMLKVNSLTHGRKLLEERCTANFSTQLEGTKFSLNDMFKTSVQLPQQAVVYPPAGLQLPDSLVSVPVILKQFRVIKSVIATPSPPQNYSLRSSMVYDINLELGIEIQEHSEIADHQMNEMRAKTQQLYSTFEPSKVVPFQVDSTENTEQVAIQYVLLTNTDDKRFLGIQLELPEWLGQMRISKAKLHSQGDSLCLQQSQDDTGSPHQRQESTVLSFQSSDFEQRMANMEKQHRMMDRKLNTLVQGFTSVVHQLSTLKVQSNVRQFTTSNSQQNDQYVDMALNIESRVSQETTKNCQDAHSPAAGHAGTNCIKEVDNQHEHQRLDEEFTAVREWQKKQEKHLQWQQEQVQHWQIECEKQMQEMQMKLAGLEDKQMKFFQEIQQKIKQWKEETPGSLDAWYKASEEVRLKSNAGANREDDERLPKPLSGELESKAVSPSNCSIKEGSSTSEVDFGLDTIADNIASWCSQMELELNELYTNSVETDQ